MKMKKTLAVVAGAAIVAGMFAGCGSSASSTAASSAAPASTAASTATSEAASSEAAKTLDWPKQNITLICPFKAGGGMDLSSRLTAKYLEKYLGVTVTVSNVEGGNSWTGWTQIAQAKGDGYTLGFANYPAQVAGYMNPSAGVEFTYRDFALIADVVSDPNVLWVSANYSPYETAEDFLNYAKENQVVIGTGGGAGCDDDILVKKLNGALGTQLVSGENSGFSDVKAAVLGGHMEAGISNVSEVYSMADVTEGEEHIRILCIFAKERNEYLPDVATFEELGLGDITNGSDRGLVGPASLDPEIYDYLVEVMKQIGEDDDFYADAKEQGMPIGLLYGDDFTAFVAETEETIQGMLPLLGWDK